MYDLPIPKKLGASKVDIHGPNAGKSRGNMQPRNTISSENGAWIK